MSLFGGIKNALSKANEVGEDGTSFLDRLGALGQIMQGDSDAMRELMKEGAARQATIAKKRALAQLTEVLGPQYAVDNTPIVQRTERTPVPELSELNMPGLSPRPEAPAPYTYQPPQRLPQRTLNDPNLQQALMAATLNGGGSEAGSVASLLRAFQPDRKYIEGPNGIYEIGADGKPQLIQEYPERPPVVSPGWMANPDGSWSPVPGGPYDPGYIAKTSGVRREAVVTRPMPRVGGGGGRGRGGGGGFTGLPPGYRPRSK